VAALVEGLSGITVTLDPTERHGFEYQTWIGFSLFGDGVPGEIGRGGAYDIVTPAGGREAAIGFSLYVDGLVDAGLGVVDPRRVLIPLHTDPAIAATLRTQGWSTVAAFSHDANPADFRCTHILDGVEPKPI
jgi:ATP phosphoribosyltransferase regulatory subunit